MFACLYALKTEGFLLEVSSKWLFDQKWGCCGALRSDLRGQNGGQFWNLGKIMHIICFRKHSPCLLRDFWYTLQSYPSPWSRTVYFFWLFTNFFSFNGTFSIIFTEKLSTFCRCWSFFGKKVVEIKNMSLYRKIEKMKAYQSMIKTQKSSFSLNSSLKSFIFFKFQLTLA